LGELASAKVVERVSRVWIKGVDPLARTMAQGTLALELPLKQVCQEFFGGDACPQHIDLAAFQSFLFELPVISSSGTAVILAIVTDWNGPYRWAWALGFAGICIAAICGAAKFVLLGSGHDAESAALVHEGVVLLASSFCMWGLGVGSLATTPGSFGKRFRAVFGLSTIAMLVLSLASIAIDQPLLVHVPVILGVLVAAYKQFPSLRTAGLLVGVLFMAVGKDIAQLEHFRSLGFAVDDAFHLFLSTGLVGFCVALAMRPMPTTGSKKGQ